MVVRAAAAIAAMPPISTRSSASAMPSEIHTTVLGASIFANDTSSAAKGLQRVDAVLPIDHRRRSRLALAPPCGRARRLRVCFRQHSRSTTPLQGAWVSAVDVERLGQPEVIDALGEKRPPAHNPHQGLLHLLAIGREVDAGAVGKCQHADTVGGGELIQEARRGHGRAPASTDADALEIEDNQDQTSADGRLVGGEGELAAGQRWWRSRRILLDELRRDHTARRPVDGEHEILRRQVRHRLAAVGDDGRIDCDEFGGGAEGGLRRWLSGGCCALSAMAANTQTDASPTRVRVVMASSSPPAAR